MHEPTVVSCVFVLLAVGGCVTKGDNNFGDFTRDEESSDRQNVDKTAGDAGDESEDGKSGTSNDAANRCYGRIRSELQW